MKTKNCCLVVSFLLWGLLQPCLAQNLESQVKAAFIFKFALFVDWPVYEDTSSDFIITVLGSNPIAEDLNKLATLQRIKKRPVKILYTSDIADISTTHILFISDIGLERLKNVLKIYSRSPVLTISDSPDYAENGVQINFKKTPENTIHFEINRTAIDKSGLRMNHLLLNIADIIND